MKRKSVAGFVTGLIGTIGAGFMAYYVYIIFAIAIGLSESSNGKTAGTTILKLLGIAYFASVILGIIAVCFYFKKARLGGIIMLFATIANAALPVYSAIGEMSFYLVIIFIPAILMGISALCGIFSKKTQIIKQSALHNNQLEKHCPNCGTTLRGNDEFCYKCGKRQ